MLLSPVNLKCASITNSLESSREERNSACNNITNIGNSHKDIKSILLSKPQSDSLIYKTSKSIDNPLLLPSKPPAGSLIYNLSNNIQSIPTFSSKIQMINNKPNLLSSQRIDMENNKLLSRRTNNKKY